MKDLENIDNRSTREDSTGNRKNEPAYKSFTKDKRSRTESSGVERREYSRRDENGGDKSGGERSEKRYNSERSDNREGGYNRTNNSGYNNDNKRSSSYGNREGGYKRQEGNRDGAGADNSGSPRRYDSTHTENGNNREGGYKRPFNSGGNDDRRSSSYGNREGRSDRSEGNREGGYKRPEGNRDGAGRDNSGSPRRYDSARTENSSNREGGYKRPFNSGGNDDRRSNSYGNRDGRSDRGEGNREGGYKRPDGGHSSSNSQTGVRRSFNPNFDSSNRPLNHNTQSDDSRNFDNKSEGSYKRPYNKEFTRQGDSGRSSSYGERRPRVDDRNTGDKSPWKGRGEGGSNSERYGASKDRPYDTKRQFDDRRQQGGRDRTQQSSGSRYNKDNYPTFPAPVIEDKLRLNRYISMSGICSRREADEFIQNGMVTVNGIPVTELGAKVSQTDEICFNGNIIKNEKKVYIVMNKPKGFVTSIEDPHADRTVMDLLKNGCRERVYPVGRLDKNSMGVLLITNDGDLAKKLTHPSFEKKKVYQVSIDKPFTHADMNYLVEGFELEDGEIHADAASYVGDKKTEIGVEIHSGRNRIVRRMFEHLGYKVTKLDRVYFAGLTKQKLKRGDWRFLSPREVQGLLSGQYE